MFLKTVLTFLAIGALSVNALAVRVARSPAPEPESQELEAWILKRDLSYELFSRELQALDGLISREPEDWAEWAGLARDEKQPQDNPKIPYIPTPRFHNHAAYVSNSSPLRNVVNARATPPGPT